MTVTVNSRVQVLNLPVAAPGVCCLCGSATKPVIDFGKNLDYYGAVYFCIEDCLREISEAMGYIPVASFDSCYDDLRKLQIDYDKLQKKYESVNNALRDVLSDNYRNCTSPIDDNDDSIPIVAEPEVIDESSESPIQRIEEAESSIDLEGSGDLFDSSDFDHEDE